MVALGMLLEQFKKFFFFSFFLLYDPHPEQQVVNRKYRVTSNCLQFRKHMHIAIRPSP